jgi:hypothetical protein
MSVWTFSTAPRRLDGLDNGAGKDERCQNECDVGGRVSGAAVGTLDEALDYLRELERSNSE